MNIVEVVVPQPDEILATGAFGAGALLAVESSAASGGTFAEVGTVAVVAGTTNYKFYDTTGASGRWYRIRYSNVGRTNQSDYSDTFQAPSVNVTVAAPTAIGSYASRTGVKLRLGAQTNWSAADDILLDTLCDQINQYIESDGAGRVLAPIASATYLFDGNGRNELWVPMGVREVTLLEIASSTAGAFTTIPAGDIFLRPLPQDRQSTWPATLIRLSDSQTGGYGTFPRGMSNVRATLAGGWAAMPDDVIELATTAVVRAWHARQAGQTDIIGTDDFGKPIVSRFLSARDRSTLQFYKRDAVMSVLD